MDPSVARMVASVVALGMGLLPAGCRHDGSRGALDRFVVEIERLHRPAPAWAASGAGSLTPGQDHFQLAAAPGQQGTMAAWRYQLCGHQPPRAEDSAAAAGSGEAPTRERSRPGPLPGLWETVKRDVRQMPGDLWEDTKAVYTSTPNLLILGLTYGGSLALQESGPDDTVEDSFSRDHHRTFKNDWRDAFGAAGSPGTHLALAGLWYLVGQQRQDDKTYQVGKTLFSALIINGLSTMVGQAASWDDAPNGEWGTSPSGHTSSSFTFASVMHQAYGHWVGIPLYALSGLVAYERLESSEHYFSDVIMGGVMGLVIGHTVAGEHEFELFGGEIVPYADPHTGTSGIAWVKHFK